MRTIVPLCIALVGLAGCRDSSATKGPSSAVVPNGSASAPAFTRGPGTTPTATATAAAAPASAAASQEAVASAAPSAETSAAPEPPEELPEVDVKNVGMHIGGEENTAAQKRPIRAAVAKHYDGMRRCYTKASDPPKATTFGVDMRIKGTGGPPKVSNPRSGLKGDGVTECLVAVFEAIEFPKQPNSMDRMVSFSVEFRRK